MKPGLDYDEGTWTSVGLAATSLNTICVGTSMFPTTHGGYTYAGLHDGVKVILTFYPPGGLELVGNQTAVGNWTSDGDTDTS